MTNTPDKSVKAEYVLGPVHECDELSEDGGDLWQAEVQLLGGYAVAATIYAGSEGAVRRMAEQAIAALQAVPASGEVGEKESVYRDIFAEITAKARPLCEDESDPEKITGYRLPVGPLHRAAGKTGFQMFNGEAHLARAVRDVDRLKTALKQVKILLISAASRDSHMAPEYERKKAREATDVIDTALQAVPASGEVGGAAGVACRSAAPCR